MAKANNTPTDAAKAIDREALQKRLGELQLAHTNLGRQIEDLAKEQFRVEGGIMVLREMLAPPHTDEPASAPPPASN